MSSEIGSRWEQSFREEGVAVTPPPSTDHEERLAKLGQVIRDALLPLEINLGASCPSDCETGCIGPDQRELVLGRESENGEHEGLVVAP
jgi:hypothetical protein